MAKEAPLVGDKLRFLLLGLGGNVFLGLQELLHYFPPARLALGGMTVLSVGLRRILAITSVLFLAVLAVSPAKNALRPYRAWQAGYREQGLSRARSLKAAEQYRERPVAIQQIWLRDFDDRVDRCTTCHLGVADPAMGDAPAPFRQPSCPVTRSATAAATSPPPPSRSKAAR